MNTNKYINVMNTKLALELLSTGFTPINCNVISDITIYTFSFSPELMMFSTQNNNYADHKDFYLSDSIKMTFNN